MRAGSLRHVIDIQDEGGATQDAYGSMAQEWTDTFTGERASVRWLSGRELFRVQQVQPEATIEIRMRYRSGITDKQRIIWNDGDATHTLQILGPPANVEGRNRELVMLCKEFTDG